MRSRVWDLFFIHGTIFLFRIALAILKLHEPELLECDSAAGLYAMLGQLPAGLWNADRLLKVRFPLSFLPHPLFAATVLGPLTDESRG